MDDLRTHLRDAAKSKRPVKDLDAKGADLSGERLFGLKADFLDASGASLRGADLQRAGLMDCDFVGADLSGADFGGALLFQCRFHDCRGEGALLYGMEAALNFWSRAHLPRARFSRSGIAGNDFGEATLEEACFDDAHGEDVSFARALLPRASFRGARLPRASFAGADVRGCDFTLAELAGADFRGAKLEGASFPGAVLGGALFDGAPPDTSGAPPSADPVQSLHHALVEGRTAAALALWRDWPRGYRRDAADDAFSLGGGAVQPESAVALLAEMLADPLVQVRERAARRVGTLAREGRALEALEALVPALEALLGGKPEVHVPEEPPRRRRTLDAGLHGALALGSLCRSRGGAGAARAALHRGLEGGAAVRQHAAAGLALACARDADWARVDALLGAGDARVREGACEGLCCFVRDVAERERTPPRTDGAFAGGPLRAHAERLGEDPVARVQKAAARLSRELEDLRG
jgi:uncharacterized protein YjbI with pentapeptide repeats